MSPHNSVQSDFYLFFHMCKSLHIGSLGFRGYILAGCSDGLCPPQLASTARWGDPQGRQQAGWVSPAQPQSSVTMGGPNLVPPAPLLFLLFLLYKEYMKAIENDAIGILHRCFKIINYIMQVKEQNWVKAINSSRAGLTHSAVYC